MPAPEWVMENWPGSATILAVRCKGTRDGKPVDETQGSLEVKQSSVPETVLASPAVPTSP